MKIKLFILSAFVCLVMHVSSQENKFEKLHFLIGNWEGTGSGFGNSTSTINASFKYALDNYIEVKNESWFEPTESNQEGEHHVDKGFISFDKKRDVFVFRQFNNEGYVNQYVLIDSLSNENTLVFETEIIENFIPGGKARWTIIKTSDDKIQTIFDVSMSEKGYSCFGKNELTRK